MSMTPAKRRGIFENVQLKMTGDRSIRVLGAGHSAMKNVIWVLVRDDGGDAPYFKSVCGSYDKRALYAEDFTPIDNEVPAVTHEVENDGYTVNQRNAVKTFTTMLERAKLYRENGTRELFDPESGICDNISNCRPNGAGYDEMYKVKDNVIRIVPSYSGNYHYPVKHPYGGDPESAWDDSSNKWSGDYGAQRIIQLEELIEHIKTKWNENLVTNMTPAMQRGIVLMETVCQHVTNGTLWVMQYDDDSSSPYFIPLGNTGREGRTDIRLKDLKILSVSDSKKRSVRSFVNQAKRIEEKRERMEKQIAKLTADMECLRGELALNDYNLSQQHGVKRITNK